MEVEICILDVDYYIEDNKPVIRIWGKDEKGRNIMVLDRDFIPYFYIYPASLTETLKEKLKHLEVEGKKPLKIEERERKLYGKPVKLIKIYIQRPQDVPKFRDVVKEWDEVKEEYEYSISFYKRYLIDKGFVPLEWIRVQGREIQNRLLVDKAIEAERIEKIHKESFPDFRILAFDIEVMEDKGEVIVISVMDSSGYKRVLSFGEGKEKDIEILKNEKEMLERFVQIIQERNPDFLIGYNTDRYDFIKLNERMEKYGIPFVLSRDGSSVVFKRRGRISSAHITGRIHIDIYDFIEHILGPSLSSEVLTLDMVAKELIGKGKDELEWEEMERAWKEGNIKRIASYCLKDSELTLELSNYILPQILELSRVVGQVPFDVARMTYSQLVEWLLMRKAFEENEIIPNTPKHDEIERRRKAPPYTGGYVYPPKSGIHKKIALFDFQSLYPSITITHNISPETLDCECCKDKEKARVPGGEHYFCLNKKGFIPKIIENLVKKRLEIKERMKGIRKDTPYYRSLYNRQYAIKVLTNASYGYYAYPGSRWYSRVCAQSIAAWGRYYIKKVIDFAKAEGLEVIYGDTDSLFLIMKNIEEAERFLEKVNKSLPGTMELEFRGMYKSGIFVPAKTGATAKKKYALLDYKGNILIRGFEKVRRDWSGIAKKTQEQVLEIILKEGSPERALEIVKETIRKLKKKAVNIKDLIIYTQLTKPLEEYESVGPHVAVAKKMVERGKPIRTGSTIRYIITPGEGSISERAEPPEDAKDYDPEYYIYNQVIPAALRVLSALGYTEKDFEERQHSLEGFFKK